jgi:GntR family transcriptional regulator
MQQVGSLPVYLQIVELFVRDIAAGRLVDGEKLAPEREMASELGIAVGTLRKALAELQERGLLERLQGSGNYVKAISDPKSVYALFRLELLDGGGLPTAQVLSIESLLKPEIFPKTGRSDYAHRIRRLRQLSGQPAAIEEIWLCASYAETVVLSEISESLYLYYRTKLGLWISTAEDRISMDCVPHWVPEGIGLKRDDSCPYIERTSFAQDGAVAEISMTWFDHRVVHYVSRLK